MLLNFLVILALALPATTGKRDSPPQTAQPPRPPRPVAWWSFDAIHGRRVPDRSGHERSARMLAHGDAAPPEEVEGIRGQALRFHRSAKQGVKIRSSQAPPLTRRFTIAMWIYREGHKRHLMIKTGGSNEDWRGYRLHCGWWGTLQFLIRGQNQQVMLKAGRWTTPRNHWAHVAATVDGRRVTLWVNAAPVAAKTLDHPWRTSRNPGPLMIGSNFFQSAWGFDGVIDEVMIFDQALTRQQLLTVARQPAREP